MAEPSKVRTPRQKRSIEKKNQIKSTTRSLMCREGYHKITTNQIAKEAGISVGSLYEYYPNKEAILSEILSEYFDDFLNQGDAISNAFKIGIKASDKRQWLRLLLHQLIEAHRATLAFNKELHSLYFSVPVVADVCDAQKSKMRAIILEAFMEIKEELCVEDIEAAVFIFMDMLDSIIDRITFHSLPFEEERLITMGIEAICRFLFEN